jgi:hypothetical protein
MKFNDYFLIRESYDRFQDELTYLIESTNATQVQNVEDFIRIKPYIFGQMIVGIMVAAIRNGMTKEQVINDLESDSYGKVMERMSKLPDGDTKYSKMFEDMIKTTNFSSLWEEVIKQYFGKANIKGHEAQQMINSDPHILLDYKSSEFDQYILGPLLDRVENKTVEKVPVEV